MKPPSSRSMDTLERIVRDGLIDALPGRTIAMLERRGFIAGERITGRRLTRRWSATDAGRDALTEHQYGDDPLGAWHGRNE